MVTITKQYLDIICSALTAQSGISIQAGKSWSYNHKTKTLNYIEADLKNTTPLDAKSLLLHEIGHILYTTDVKKTALNKKFPKSIHEINNMAEDIRIMNLLAENFNTFASASLKQLNTSAVSEFKSDDLKDLSMFRQVLLYLETQGQYMNGLLSYDDSYTFLHYRLPESTYSFIDKNNHEFDKIISHCRNANNTQELADIVENELYPILEDLIKQEDQKNGQGQPDHNPKSKPKKPQKLTDYEPDNGISFKGLPENEIEALNMPIINTLSHRFNDILKERKAVRFQGNYKRGHLNNKDVYKIITGDNRPFSRRNNPNVPDYELWLLLDSSGSMNDFDGFQTTYESAILLKAIAKKLNFNTRLFNFSDRTFEIEDLNDDYLSKCGGGTNDRNALETIIENAEKTPNDSEKLLFVITDGQSNGSLDSLFSKLERLNFTTIGVAIGSYSVLMKRYQHRVQVPDVATLPTMLINKLKMLIKR